MDKPTIKCALLSTMLAKHRWGTPISREDLIRLSAVGDDYPAARDVYDDLRSQPYITNHGKRGITLNNSQFNELADVLYHECGWEKWQIDSRLKHYEGIENHDWA